jgi:DNA polymerase delta subunit 1
MAAAQKDEDEEEEEEHDEAEADGQAEQGFNPDLDDFAAEEEDESVEDAEGGEPMQFDDADDNLPFLDPMFMVSGSSGGGAAGGAVPYERPAAAKIDPQAEDFFFQHTESTYAIDPNTHAPEVRIWGVNAAGNSVLFRDQNFKPYFFVQIDNLQDAIIIRDNLNSHFGKEYGNSNSPNAVHDGLYVLNVEPVLGRSICGWHRNLPLKQMFKFTMAHPSHVAKARNCLEFANRAVTVAPYKTYEANVPFELRYMIDAKINGCEWIRVKSGTYEEIGAYGRVSTAQYEFVSKCKNACEPVPSDQKGDLAPMRYLSYDIEVLRRKRGFPTCKEDSVILIAAALNVTGKGIVHKAVFCLAPTSSETSDGGGKPWYKPIEGADVYVYKTERQLLLAFSRYVQECDPEALTGWNTTDFDLPYLAGRAKVLGCYDPFMSFSRIIGKRVWIRQKTFQSKAYGAKVSNEMLCEGRFDYDGLTFMLRGQMEKYRSYKLNYISQCVLEDQKVDVDYSQIPTLYDGDDEDRTRLSWYCLKVLGFFVALLPSACFLLGVRRLLEFAGEKSCIPNTNMFEQRMRSFPCKSLKSSWQSSMALSRRASLACPSSGCLHAVRASRRLATFCVTRCPKSTRPHERPRPIRL